MRGLVVIYLECLAFSETPVAWWRCLKKHINQYSLIMEEFCQDGCDDGCDTTTTNTD